MYEDKREDDFNAWIRREGCFVQGLKIAHAQDEECWVAILEHKDETVECENENKILAFLQKSNQEGYINRHWYEDLYDTQLKRIGKRIAFCYNG